MTRAHSSSSLRRPTATFPLLVLLASSAVLLAEPQRAHAFSDTEYFKKPTEQGGGGGRFFTGSPVDGFACSVCHRGGTEPQVQVIGLPVEGYQPGRPYDIELVFQSPGNYALQLELIGRDGRVAGDVKLLDPIDARGHCNKELAAPAPGYVSEAGGRKIIGVEDCGAGSVRFRFIPPNVPDVAFSASIVTSDRRASVEGDGVLNLRRVLRRQGEPAQTGDCSLSPGRGSQAVGWLAGLATLVLIAVRTRKRRA